MAQKSIEWEGHWWGTVLRAKNKRGKIILRQLLGELEDEPKEFYDNGNIHIDKDDEGYPTKIELTR